LEKVEENWLVEMNGWMEWHEEGTFLAQRGLGNYFYPLSPHKSSGSSQALFPKCLLADFAVIN